MARSRHRLFYALYPSPPAARRICSVANGLDAAHRPVAEDRRHMTIGISEDFDDFRDAPAGAMIAIGGAVALPPVPVRLDLVVGSHRSIALRPRKAAPALRALHLALDGPLARQGIRRRGWSFAPHVTLAYRDGAPFRREIAPIAWESADFVLIHSIVGETRHILLGRWPLVPRQYSLGLG